MSAQIIPLPPRQPDAVPRQPEHHRRADHVTQPLGNLRAVSPALGASLLGEFSARVAGGLAGAVHADTLRAALSPVIQKETVDFRGES
jgi:hypothetical protein